MCRKSLVRLLELHASAWFFVHNRFQKKGSTLLLLIELCFSKVSLSPCSNIFYTIVCFSVLNLHLCLLANAWTFWGSPPFTPNHETITWYLWTCSYVEYSTSFQAFCCSRSNILKCFVGINFRIRAYLQKSGTLIVFPLYYFYTKYILKIITKTSHLI